MNFISNETYRVESTEPKLHDAIKKISSRSTVGSSFVGINLSIFLSCIETLTTAKLSLKSLKF